MQLWLRDRRERVSWVSVFPCFHFGEPIPVGRQMTLRGYKLTMVPWSWRKDSLYLTSATCSKSLELLPAKLETQMYRITRYLIRSTESGPIDLMVIMTINKEQTEGP